jgi:hypothetical protein
MLLTSGRGTVPFHGVHRSAALRVKLCIGESKLIASRFCRLGRAALLRGASNKPLAQAKSSCPAGSPARRSLRLVSPAPTLRRSQRLPPRQQRQRLTQFINPSARLRKSQSPPPRIPRISAFRYTGFPWNRCTSFTPIVGNHAGCPGFAGLFSRVRKYRRHRRNCRLARSCRLRRHTDRLQTC